MGSFGPGSESGIHVTSAAACEALCQSLTTCNVGAYSSRAREWHLLSTDSACVDVASSSSGVDAVAAGDSAVGTMVVVLNVLGCIVCCGIPHGSFCASSCSGRARLTRRQEEATRPTITHTATRPTRLTTRTTLAGGGGDVYGDNGNADVHGENENAVAHKAAWTRRSTISNISIL